MTEQDKSAHTPGAWVARDEDSRGAIYSDAAYPGRPIATAASYWQGDGPRAEERQANARLIAAAPELFDYVQSSAMNGCATAIRLVAKATGADQ